MTVTAMKPRPADDTDDAEATPKKSRKKLLIVALVGVLVLGGAGYWFFLKPAAPETGPSPGEVVKLDSIQVNLSGGHYLKIGIALQLTDSAHEVDGSKALDATIALFSGRSMAVLAKQHDREELKVDLEKQLEELYHGDVMGVYFTDFVTQ